MSKETMRSSIAHVGAALRDPEEFVLRGDRGGAYGVIVWAALALTAMLGTTAYGLTMGIGAGSQAMGAKALLLTVAAGLAWAVPLPALYILNSLAGARLTARTTLLAVLVTTSWGGLALLASIPINWFVSVAIPAQSDILGESLATAIVLAVNLLVFAGVGVSMGDIFRRVMEALEPDADLVPTWVLLLVGAIGSQLFYLFGLFAW